MTGFAYKIDGQWTEITGLVTIAAVHYPAEWIIAATAPERAAIGVYPIGDADPAPDDHRVIGTRIEDRYGLPVRVIDAEPINPAERRAALVRLVDSRAATAFGAGFAPAHPAFDGQRLQVRNNEDRTNWLTSQASYAAAVSAGYGDVIDASFRTTSNATITVSYADGLNILLAMAAWGRDIFARSWALKDAIDAGAPYDIDTGWPE